MAETNLTTSADLVAQSVDFVNQFTQNLSTLLSALGVLRKQPLTAGSQVKIYKSEVTKVDGNVPEGEVIPLSKVTRKLADTKELTFQKYRKLTPMEAIQRAGGITPAIVDTDAKLMRSVQDDLKGTLFGYITKNDASKTKAEGKNFQEAMAAALGEMAVKWEGYSIQKVAFANPLDFYKHLGSQAITVQSAFGLQYVQNFLGFNTIIMSEAVPQDLIATTASNNINYYYAPISSLGALFNMQTDETGLIGVTHAAINNNLTYETVITLSNLLLTERLDGIVLSSIKAPAASTK